ncbi:MAG: hypothetical protein HYY13_03175 [Nitrospirae bacterium]|nr:hypothetical protein [Nitrospirota bacterium]
MSVELAFTGQAGAVARELYWHATQRFERLEDGRQGEILRSRPAHSSCDAAAAGN